MQFLSPSLLWVLLALAIPIIIHLFHFRRFKKVYFTNVKFLKEIKEEKSTRNKIRKLLVLLARMAAIACLVFAFAQPFLAKDAQTKSGKNYVSIFVDNSNSMMAASEDIPLLDKAKKKAEEIILAYGPSDQFQVLSHEMKGVQQRWLNKENAIAAIANVEINPEVTTLSKVHFKQKQTAPTDGNHLSYMLSDFQKSITDLDLLGDSLMEVNLLPFQAVKENNLAIDTAWFEAVVPSINQNNKLYIRIKNHSDERKEDVRLSIEHNGQTRPEGTINIPANSSVTDTVNLLVTTPGWQQMKIKIDDYPIQFDDHYFINFNVKEKVSVLSVHELTANKYLSALFKGLNQFDLSNTKATNLQYDKFKDYDLIILSDLRKISSGFAAELKTYADNGGNVLVFPSADAELDSYNDLFGKLNINSIKAWSKEERAVHKINTAEFVFSNVYKSTGNNLKLPNTKGNFEFTNFSARGGEYLLKYRDGQNFISKYNSDKGKIYICAAPLDKKYNDLTINAEVFVPLLYKVAFSNNQSERLAYTIGKDNLLEVNSVSSGNDLIYKVQGEEEFIPGQTSQGKNTLITFNNMVRKSGFYNLKLQDQIIKGLAFNYDRIESDLAHFSKAELESTYGANSNILDNTLNADLTSIIKEKDQGITLWRWCLIFALLFLAIETLLLRFWKI